MPIGVSCAASQPSIRSMTHLSIREFSPKPGQTKDPSSSRRNQFTEKMCGSLVASASLPRVIRC